MNAITPVPTVPFPAGPVADNTPDTCQAAADPRVGPLLDLVQSLFTALGDVGTNFSSAVTDPLTRSRVLAHAEDNIRLCRDRLNTILATTP